MADKDFDNPRAEALAKCCQEAMKIERERIADSLDCEQDCIGRDNIAKGQQCTWSYDGVCSKALAESIRNQTIF